MTDSSPRQILRTRILQDMGIDVWHLRVAEVGRTAAPAAETATATAAASAPAATPAAGSARQPVREPPRRAARPARAAPEPAVAEPAAVEPAPVEALEVVSVALSGAVVLVDGEPSQRDLRLVMDLVAAATGRWQDKPVVRRFVWPPPGSVGGDSVQAAIGAGSGSRALRAFAAKDLQDHEARLLVCTAALAQRLPDEWPDCRRAVVDSLAELSRDADAKRALWQAMQRSVPASR